MTFKIAVWAGLGLFALLSVTDWVLTYKILSSFPTAVETNPFAAACLKHAGWVGLAFYKTATVVVFCSGVILLLKRRPPVAASVVAVGCAALMMVTFYSHNLYSTASRLTENAPHSVVWPSPERCLPPEEQREVPAEWFADEPQEQSETGTSQNESDGWDFLP